jgi:hypothetical protein
MSRFLQKSSFLLHLPEFKINPSPWTLKSILVEGVFNSYNRHRILPCILLVGVTRVFRARIPHTWHDCNVRGHRYVYDGVQVSNACQNLLQKRKQYQILQREEHRLLEIGSVIETAVQETERAFDTRIFIPCTRAIKSVLECCTNLKVPLREARGMILL